MAEAYVASQPQVFVVDSQASYVPVPVGRKRMWERAVQKLNLVLLGLVVFGLVIQGYLIHNLYKKTEAMSLYMSHPVYQNLSDPRASGLKGGIILSQVGPKDSFDASTLKPQIQQIQQKPFANLMGSSQTLDQDNVVQWLNNSGETVTRNMSHSNGRLLVEEEGYYYIYSKMTLEVKDCSFFQHQVLKDTKAYGKPIRLMNSKRHCGIHMFAEESSLVLEELWNSFLAGIFHLQKGDKIYVKLESRERRHPAPADNMMGAFLIST